MIVEALLNVIFLMVNGVISLFPKIPAIDLSFLDGVIQVISLVDMFVSVKVFSTCLVTIFVFLKLELIWSIVVWVYKKFPGVS